MTDKWTDTWLLIAIVVGLMFGFMMGLAAMHQQRNAVRDTLHIWLSEAVQRGHIEVWRSDSNIRTHKWKDPKGDNKDTTP